MLPIKSGLARAVSQSLSIFAKPKTTKAYLLYSLDEDKVVSQNNQNYWFKAASIVKLIYAIDLMHQIERGEIKKQKIKIIDKYLINEGTNLLRDLTLDSSSQPTLSLKTLIRLMLKYSCNGSTHAIWDHIVIPIDKFRNRLGRVWRINTQIFDTAGNFNNIMRPTDILEIYRHIYDDGLNILGKDAKKFLQDCLEEGKSRYSIFDQKTFNIKILGCKGGQIFEPAPTNKAYYHDSGAFLVRSTGKKYIIITMTESLDFASSRDWTRKIGKKLLSVAEKN